MSQRISIKKYANRRLYDTEKSKYITLAEVKERVCEGREISVVDVNTGEDMTAFILTQVILEEARRKNTLLPVPFLHLIIRYGDNVLGEFFEKYLQQILSQYLHQKASFDERFRRALDFGMEFSGMARKNMENVPPFTSLMDFFSGGSVEKK